MGIKFLCPNGHKLHVKSFLSGKKAICPKCGARVIVPSDPNASDDSLDVSTASVEIRTVEAGLAAAAAPVSSPPPQAPSKADSTAAIDPIDEAPNAVWYVRPISGGQFGPASGEIMRGWVRENRVGASSLVWRAGWPDWRSAADVFPELRNLLVAPGAPLPVTPMDSDAVQVPPPAPPESPVAELLSQTLRKRRRRNEVSLMTSGVLLAISVILVIVLLVVFRAQSIPVETPPAENAAAKG
jgi:hypothetical protein